MDKIEWLEVINNNRIPTKRTDVLNLPNGCLIKYTSVWTTMVYQTMQFVPDLNYKDGEFKIINY